MLTQPISFGKVIMVNAPLTVANRISAIANGGGNSKIEKQIKKIVNDTNKGRAYTYSFDHSKPESYIFSGKDGKKYWDMHCQACDRVDYINFFYEDEYSAESDIKDIWDVHRSHVEKMIQSSPYITKLDVDFDNVNKKIKSINVLA